MSFNQHRKNIQPEWQMKRKGVDVAEVADVLRDNVNNYRNNQEQLRAQEIEKTQKETGVNAQEAEKSKNELANNKAVQAAKDIAQGNRMLVQKELKKNKSRLSKRGYRKLMVNAEKDGGVRKAKDAFGLARIAKEDIKDLPTDSLFSFDLSKVPSSRRRRIKSQRSKTLNAMEKSKKLRSRSNLFKGRGNKMVMKKIRVSGYSKKEKDLINRLRGLGANSPIKGRASQRSVARTKIVHRGRER